jgi:hypothetical protein
MTDKQKVSHDVLYRELHNLDNLVEKHAELVLAISAALFAFASAHLNSPPVVWLASAFGFAAAVEWILKIVRHRRLFRSAHEKLGTLETQIGIDTLRPLKRPYKNFFSLDGFTILLWLAMLLIVFWPALSVCVGIGVFSGLSPKRPAQLTDIYTQVETTLPMLSGSAAQNWQLLDLQHQPQTQSFEFTFQMRSGQDKATIVFNTDLGKIVKFQRQ